MSVQYVTVQWTKRKIVYDAIVVAGVAAYVTLFGALAHRARPDISEPIHAMRAWGSCAFVMLTAILCLGPLARLDTRFLPLVYNRRHFGVLMFVVGLMHARAVLGFYHAYSGVPETVSLLTYDVAFTPSSWPFQLFGASALAILFVMAVTSHDFWQRTLGLAWKSLHMGVYVAFALVILHVAYGALMLETHPAYAGFVSLAASLVIGLHLVAGWRSTALDRAPVALVDHEGERWIDAGDPGRIPKDRALPVLTPRGERLALIRHDGGVSAIHGVCAHQGGPLYEGKVIDGCLTCPWHGWQYRPADGQSPPPFTEKLPTYRVCIGANGHVLVHPDPAPPGTVQAPARIEGSRDA